VNLSKRATIIASRKGNPKANDDSWIVREICLFLERETGQISNEWYEAIRGLTKEIAEAEGLSLAGMEIQDGHLLWKVSGRSFHVAPKDIGIEEFARKFQEMMTVSPGKALVWLKENSTLT
jgi:hypothetical protein